MPGPPNTVSATIGPASPGPPRTVSARTGPPPTVNAISSANRNDIARILLLAAIPPIGGPLSILARRAAMRHAHTAARGDTAELHYQVRRSGGRNGARLS